MADPPRRVSMSWMLGLSKKGPFKGEKLPSPPHSPKPNEFVKMMTTPGAPLEWAASDGRRHKLTGKHKSRLVANLASVPAPTPAPDNTTKSKSPPLQKAASKKAESEVGGLGDLFGAFGGDDAGDSAKKDAEDDKTKEDAKDRPNNHGFTEADDMKLMELKNSDKNHPWSAIAKALDKPEGICKARFGQIKPKDWRPPLSQKKGGGKKGKSQDKKTDETKDEKEKPEDTANAWNTDTWGAGNTDGEKNNTGDTANQWDSGGGGGDGWGQVEGGDGAADQWDSNNDWNTGEKAKEGGETTDLWGGAVGDTASKKGGSNAGSNAGDNAANPWNNTGGDGGGGGGWDTTAATGEDAANAWDTNNQGWENNQKDTGDAANAWDNNKVETNKKSPSKAGSTKPAPKANSHAGSKSTHSHARQNAKTSVVGSTELKLYPDDTFSSTELKQVARILHQDRAMLWERVAHRFADKTNRRLPPEVFEKKFKHAEKARKKE